MVRKNIINHNLDIKKLNIEDFEEKLNIYELKTKLFEIINSSKRVPDSPKRQQSSNNGVSGVQDSDDEDSFLKLGTQEHNQNSSMLGGTINSKQQEPPYNRYEKSDYVHDFEQLRGNKKLHDLFKNTSMDKKVRTKYGGMAKRKREDPINSTYNKILNEINDNEIVLNEDNIVDSLGLPFFSPETVNLKPYNNGKMYSTEITSLEEYERIKYLPINEKIKKMFEEDNSKDFSKLIDKCKEIYGLIKENKCDYLQFDQGDTKKLLLETPISPNSTIGLTRLRNLPTLIDGAGSSKIDTIIENKNNPNKNNPNKTNAEYWTKIYNSIFHGNNLSQLTFGSVDYNKVGNSSNGFKINNIIINNGFTVDNLKEVMCNITGVINLQQDNEILKLINNVNDNDNLQILRKLKFIGDRGQIVSAMKDNENNFTSRTLLGSGDRIFIAYALEQQEPIIFSNQFITRLYVPDKSLTKDELEMIKQKS